MDARTQRTLLRVGTLLGAMVVATLIIVFVPNLDPKFYEAVLGVAITAALGLDQFLKNSGDTAPPTLAAVNEAMKPSVLTINAMPGANITAATASPRQVSPPSAPTPKV